MIELALAVQLLVWFVILAVFIASGQATIFHPGTVYLAFHALVFVLRPVLVHNFGFDANWEYMIFKPTEGYFVKTLAVSSVALVCFMGACLWTGRARIRFPAKADQPITSNERRALLVTTILLLPLVGYSIYATRNGIAGERVNGIYIMTNSTGYLNDAQHLMIPLIAAWLVTTRFHWLNLAPIVAYIGYRTWFGWSRWTILLFLLMTVLVYCWYQRRRWLPVWSIAVAIPILFVFNLLGHNRDLVKQFLTGESVKVVQGNPGMTPEEKLKAQLDTQDYANFDYLSYVVSAVPERSGAYSYGAQYLQLFTEPIPRLLWKGKPAGAPVRTIDIGAYGNFIGLTVSLCGDGWISGGWVGLVLTLSCAGVLLGRAHRSFWQNTEKAFPSLFYLVALAMIPQWYRDGGISIAKFLFWNLSPLALWLAVNWFLGPRYVRGYSILVPAGTKTHFLEAQTNHRASFSIH